MMEREFAVAKVCEDQSLEIVRVFKGYQGAVNWITSENFVKNPEYRILERTIQTIVSPWAQATV